MKNTIKKLLIITIYIGLIFISTKVYAASAGTVLNNSTRIRKEASTSADIVTILSKNTEVKIVSEEGEWYKVTYKSYTGYIRKDMLKVDADTTTNNTTSNTTANTTTNTTTSNTTENTAENNEINTTTNLGDNNTSSNPSEQTQNTTSSNDSTESENEANENTTTQNSESSKEILQKGYKGTLSTSIGIKVLPTINSSIIETLSENTQFTITDVINKWCYIETENNSGWVLLSKIESKAENTTKTAETTEQNNETSQENEKEVVEENKEETTEENTEKTTDSKEETTKTETTKQETITKYVSTETLNVRETPDNNAKIVTQITLNTQVTITEVVDSTWSKISVKGTTGYVASKFLSDKKTEKTSRSENETRTNLGNTTNSENTESNNTAETLATNDTSKNKDTANTNNSSNTKTSTSSSSSSVTGASVVAYAKQYLGYKYVSGGTSPSTGFDCSGFTYYVYKHFGITLNRTSTAQIQNGTAVSKSNLKEGDILIFNNSANTAIGHAGIYIGGNTFIHAVNSSKGVITTSLSDSYYSKRYVAARRIIN